METAERKIYRGHTIPYGTLADASYEVKQAFYYHGYKNDDDLPELPVNLAPDFVEPPDPDEVVARKEMRRVVEEMLDTLTRREAKVLRMRFGIGTDADLTLEEVGVRFDVSRERIRQIEAQALRKLKHPQRRDVLVQFVYPEDIKTTADKRRERDEAIKRIMAQDIELQAQVVVKRSTRPELQQPRTAGVPWTEHLKRNAPDIYASLKTHVEKYADQYLPR